MCSAVYSVCTHRGSRGVLIGGGDQVPISSQRSGNESRCSETSAVPLQSGNPAQSGIPPAPRDSPQRALASAVPWKTWPRKRDSVCVPGKCVFVSMYIDGSLQSTTTIKHRGNYSWHVFADNRHAAACFHIRPNSNIAPFLYFLSMLSLLIDASLMWLLLFYSIFILSKIYF